MKNIFVLFVILAVGSATAIDLNELCSGILFATLAHPTENNLFIGCIKGKGTVLACDDGEVFDRFRVQCVTNVVSPPPSYEERCRSVIFDWFPYEDDCELYVVCEFGETRIRKCPEGSIFHERLPGCVPGNSETCEFEHETTESPPTGTEGVTDTTPTYTEETTETAPTVEELTTEEETTEIQTELTTEIGWSTEDQTDTTEVETTVTESTTQEETTVTESTSTPQSTPTTTTRTTTRNPNGVGISFVCPSDGFGLIPNINNCSRYFECIQGIRWPRECEGNQIFDVITNKCGNPETSLCAVNIRCE